MNHVHPWELNLFQTLKNLGNRFNSKNFRSATLSCEKSCKSYIGPKIKKAAILINKALKNQPINFRLWILLT